MGAFIDSRGLGVFVEGEQDPYDEFGGSAVDSHTDNAPGTTMLADAPASSGTTPAASVAASACPWRLILAGAGLVATGVATAWCLSRKSS